MARTSGFSQLVRMTLECSMESQRTTLWNGKSAALARGPARTASGLDECELLYGSTWGISNRPVPALLWASLPAARICSGRPGIISATGLQASSPLARQSDPARSPPIGQTEPIEARTRSHQTANVEVRERSDGVPAMISPGSKPFSIGSRDILGAKHSF
jgi:hypothetical protein